MKARVTFRALALGALLLSGLAREADAQVAGTVEEVERLTLDAALEIARRANPGYRQAEAALDLNPIESRATWANQVLPDVNINLLRTGYGGNLTRRATDFFGNPIENPEAEWVFNSSTRQGITLNWTIQGLSLFDAWARQKQTNVDRTLQVDATGWTLGAEVRRSFFDALEARHLLEVEESIRESREVDLESARRLFDIAQRSRVDVLTAELQVAQQDQNIQQQLRSYEQAVLALRTVLGDPDLGPIEPAEEEIPVFDPSALDAEALVELAVRANPTLEQARSGVSGARLGVREARRNWYPSLNLNFDYGRLAQTREAEAFLDLDPQPTEWQSSFSVFLSLPALENYFQDRADVARAQVELENQEFGLRERRLTVEQQVRTEFINLRNQYQSLELATRSLAIAGETVRLAREEYRLGTRTFEQLQEAVSQEADARRQVIQARYGFVDALLALEEAVGRPLAPSATGGR
jgi:outer membrane protein